MSPEDRNIDLITHWLTGRIDDDAIKAGLTMDGLSGEGAEAVGELMTELRRDEEESGSTAG